jgi:hypothetical protein
MRAPLSSAAQTRVQGRANVSAVACRAHDVKSDSFVHSAAVAAATTIVSASMPAFAADAVALNGDVVTAAGAIAGVAGLGGLLVATDPQRRRNTMAQGAGGDEMASVKDYFETAGVTHPLTMHRVNFACVCEQFCIRTICVLLCYSRLYFRCNVP